MTQFRQLVQALTVAVLWWQHSLQGRAREPPSLVLQVVTGSVSRAVFVRTAVGGATTRVRDDGVQDAERGQGEASLVRAQLEPENEWRTPGSGRKGGDRVLDLSLSIATSPTDRKFDDKRTVRGQGNSLLGVRLSASPRNLFSMQKLDYSNVLRHS